MTEEEFYARFYPMDRGIDETLLERIWARLDGALADDPLRVRQERTKSGTIRVIELMRLLAFRIHAVEHRIDCYWIEPEGSYRPFGVPMRAPGLFQGPFWLRFAFQRWAPESSRIDFVVDANNRPAEIELRTSQAVMARLRCDRRYSELAARFDEVLGTAAFVNTLVVENPKSMCRSAENFADAWVTIERTNASIRRLCGQQVGGT